MAGFGPEDDHFVVELTYNYGIKTYQLGNDFQVTIYHQGYGTLMAIFPCQQKYNSSAGVSRDNVAVRTLSLHLTVLV